MALAIAEWHKHFAYKKADEAKDIFWRRHPVTHTSTGFRRLMQDEDGRSAYVVFVVIVDLCARAKSRGVLMRDGVPIDAAEVSIASGIPKDVCEKAFTTLQSKRIGWLIDSKSIENRSESDSESILNLPSGDSESNKEKSQSREEKKKDTPLPPEGEPAGFVAFWEAWPRSDRKHDRKGCLRKWVKRKLEQHAAHIVADVNRRKQGVDWMKSGGQFICAPMVYLNRSMWEAAQEPSTLTFDMTEREA
jgi:hypothetical protein